jgi:hypothetical protein
MFCNKITMHSVVALNEMLAGSGDDFTAAFKISKNNRKIRQGAYWKAMVHMFAETALAGRK